MSKSGIFISTLAAAALSLLAALPALAGEIKPFQQKDFDAAQTAGAPVVVHISATWCPTCAAQHPVIERLTKSADFKDLTVFQVDFDTQKDVVRKFGANMQSTLIAYSGKAETKRSVGDTKAASIEALFTSSLGGAK